MTFVFIDSCTSLLHSRDQLGPVALCPAKQIFRTGHCRPLPPYSAPPRAAVEHLTVEASTAAAAQVMLDLHVQYIAARTQFQRHERKQRNYYRAMGVGILVADPVSPPNYNMHARVVFS